jgi:hypothetical protein
MGFGTQGGVMIFKVTNFSPKSLKRLSALLGLKLLCTLLAVFVFARFSPLIDADLYLSGFYASDASLRTRIIQGIVLTLSKFGGTVFVHWFFGVISLAGVIYYYWRGGVRWQLCVAFLLPSTLIWTSVIGKEAIFYGAFTLVLVIWARFVARKCDWTDYVVLTVSAVTCFLLRPHYAVVIFWLFGSAVLVEKYNKDAWPWLCLVALLGVGILLAFAWEPLLWRGFGAIEPAARASRFILFDIEPRTVSGFETYKSLLPLGAILGIIGPMPIEVYSRPIFIPFLLEGVLILIFPAVVYLYASKQSFDGKQRFRAIFWMCLVPAILALMVLHAPFGLLNPGSATRWRVNFEAIFHIAPMLLLYGFFDNDRNANHPFPS